MPYHERRRRRALTRRGDERDAAATIDLISAPVVNRDWRIRERRMGAIISGDADDVSSH